MKRFLDSAVSGMKLKHELPLQSRDRGVGGCECINNHIKNIQ